MTGVNIWTEEHQINGKGRNAIITRRIRVQHGRSKKTHLLTWPDCLNGLSEDELNEVIDGVMLMVIRKNQGVDLEGSERRRYVGGMLVSDPEFWQRMRARARRG